MCVVKTGHNELTFQMDCVRWRSFKNLVGRADCSKRSVRIVDEEGLDMRRLVVYSIDFSVDVCCRRHVRWDVDWGIGPLMCFYVYLDVRSFSVSLYLRGD